MSLLSQLVEHKITPEQFVAGAAADLKNDISLFQAIPGVSTIEGWAEDALSAFLLTKGLSGTLVDLIISSIKNLLNPPAPVNPS